MKVSALIFLCIATVTVAVAIPVQPEYGDDTQLTLADLENEQQNVAGLDENGVRDKRFILKKLALAKLAHLGLGALGIAGAAITTKAVLHHLADWPTHHSYIARASPRVSYVSPSGAYHYNQYFR